jgi:hypothetical protein
LNPLDDPFTSHLFAFPSKPARMLAKVAAGDDYSPYRLA